MQANDKLTMRRVLLPHQFSEHPAPAGGAVRDFHGLSMGTTWSVRLVGHGTSAHLQEGLQCQLDLVVSEMSHWLPDSDLGRFNCAPAGTWHSLPAAFFEVLAFAMSVSRDSGGAYDPCAGAMVNRWGFGPEQRFDDLAFQAPSAGEIGALLAQGRGRRVELDHAGRRARQPGGVFIDLSSVAKGYSVDRLAHYLEMQGIRHYLVEVGGELRGAGTKPDGQPWWVALEQVSDTGPIEHSAADAAVNSAVNSAADADSGDDSGANLDANLNEIVLALHGLSVATSGDYRRYFLQDGQRFSHTLDARTAAPVCNGIASVTVVHADCMAADAWSTALTVLGLEAGLALAERQGLAARFLVRSGSGLSEHMSSLMHSMQDA